MCCRESSFRKFHQIEISEAVALINSNDLVDVHGSLFPRFDLAIVSTLQEADVVIRPTTQNTSLVRARGAILVFSETEVPPVQSNDDLLLHALLERNIELRTSRCGDARASLELLDTNPELAKNLEETLISFRSTLDGLNDTFQKAKNSTQCIKALIEIQQESDKL